MLFLVATNVVASRPPERWPTGTLHARANISSFVHSLLHSDVSEDSVWVSEESSPAEMTLSPGFSCYLHLDHIPHHPHHSRVVHPKKISTQNFFQSQNFSPTKMFQTQIYFGPKYFSGLKLFLTKNNFWTHFVSEPKRCLEGENKWQSFKTLSFLNWQRAKVLLKLEFDTEDQVLSLLLIFDKNLP